MALRCNLIPGHFFAALAFWDFGGREGYVERRQKHKRKCVCWHLKMKRSGPKLASIFRFYLKMDRQAG